MRRPKSSPCRAVGWTLALWLALLFGGLATEARAEAPPPTASSYRRRTSRPNPQREFTFATFNVQNLFRYHRHPLNPNRTSADGTEMQRAHYLPASPTAYRTKVEKLAATIVDKLGTPDLLSLQEVENFKVNRRGQKHVLADLCDEIKKQTAGRGDISYSFAFSPGLSDRRGISNAFIYRSDRVALEQVDSREPVLGQRTKGSELNREVANPKSLNQRASRTVRRDQNGWSTMARPALVGKFTIFRDGVGTDGPKETLYVLNQHLKSQPQRFHERRREQAGFTAELVKELVAADPRAKVIVAGDMNVDFNQVSQSKQLRKLQNMTPANPRTPTLLDNLTAKLGEGERFSYTYRGRQLLLDWVYASKSLAPKMIELRIPHDNSLAKDATERSSDHDPVLTRFRAFGAR